MSGFVTVSGVLGVPMVAGLVVNDTVKVLLTRWLAPTAVA